MKPHAERHLDGTVAHQLALRYCLRSLARPDLLITARAGECHRSRRKDRDAALIGMGSPCRPPRFLLLILYPDTITTTLFHRVSLLLPCDASTRVLELLVLLDQHWSFARLKYRYAFLAQQAAKCSPLCRSMMEWLGVGEPRRTSARRLWKAQQ